MIHIHMMITEILNWKKLKSAGSGRSERATRIVSIMEPVNPEEFFSKIFGLQRSLPGWVVHLASLNDISNIPEGPGNA